MVDPRTLVLVDGSSYLYRAFHALPPLTNSRGEPTGAVLGVLNMLLRMMREQDPALVAVVFDAPGRTFRDDLFAEYKAHRAPMPDDLRSQVEPLVAAVQSLGLPLLRIPGVEADDVIGTLAQRAVAAGMKVVVSTGDKDMAQLVNEHITLINTMTNSSLDRAGVKIKFDVYPEQIIDYLALVGDASDNIPGVQKVGPKTAAKWLNEYRTLDNLLAHQERIEGKVGESLRASQADLALSRELATIRCDVELPLGPEDLRRQCARQGETARALHEARAAVPAEAAGLGRGGRDGAATVTCSGGTGLGSVAGWQYLGWRSRRAAAAPDGLTAPAAGWTGGRHYELVLTAEHFDRWLDALRRADLFAFDTETTSLDYMKAEIVGVSFCDRAGPCRLRAAQAHVSRRAAAAGPRRRACDSCSPCSRTTRAASSATTSSTTRTCCATTASNCAACGSTRCSSRTCSTAPRRGTTSTRPRGSTSASRRSTTRTSRARAPSRSSFNDVPIEIGGGILGRGRRRRIAPAPDALAAARGATEPGAALYGNRAARSCRCCSTWSIAAY